MSQEIREFDLNDPNLSIDLPDDYDPEAEVASNRPRPPKDGQHTVRVRLIETKEEPVYTKDGRSVLAACKVQIVKDDGSNGAFLRDWYPSTRPRKNQKSTDLAFLCRALGSPLPSTTVHPKAVIEHVQKAFDARGDEGAVVRVKTQWVKSIQVDGQYVETKGEALIGQAAVAAAQNLAYEEGWDAEKTEKAIQYAVENPHLFVDANGEERSARAEVQFLVGA